MDKPKALQLHLCMANDPLHKADHTRRSFGSIVGSTVGLFAAVALAAVIVLKGGFLSGVLAVISVVVVSYVVADATAETGFGEFMRGFMIGFNAGLNATIVTAILSPGAGIVLGVINFLAAFDTISNRVVYQGSLGWFSWLMPMSLLATAVGLLFFVLNVIPAILTLNRVGALKIKRLSIDWKTGTSMMEGGWTFLPGFRGGFNLGNFAYLTPGSTVGAHETGHTLCNAAFGSVFHFVGAIDENALRANPHDAYAERLAESHNPHTSDPWIIPMWRVRPSRSRAGGLIHTPQHMSLIERSHDA